MKKITIYQVGLVLSLILILSSFLGPHWLVLCVDSGPESADYYNIWEIAMFVGEDAKFILIFIYFIITAGVLTVSTIKTIKSVSIGYSEKYQHLFWTGMLLSAFLLIPFYIAIFFFFRNSTFLWTSNRAQEWIGSRGVSDVIIGLSWGFWLFQFGIIFMFIDGLLIRNKYRKMEQI